MPGNRQVTVSWEPPAYSGGSPITNYIVYLVGSQAVTLPASQTTHTFIGLENGREYRLTVAASNSAGTSTPSQESAPVTPFGPATSPINLVVSSDAPYELRVAWEPPVSDEGAPIIGYQVTETRNQLPVRLVDPDDTFVDYLDVSPGQYAFRVVALNRAGAGEAALTTTFELEAPPPEAPDPADLGHFANPPISDSALTALANELAEAVAGGAERVPGTPRLTVSGGAGILTLPIAAGDEVSGASISIRAGNLILDVSEGQGTAIVSFGSGVSISGPAALELNSEGRVIVRIDSPRIRLQPSIAAAPVPQSVGFDVGVTELPGETRFELTYSPSSDSFGITNARISETVGRLGLSVPAEEILTSFGVRVRPIAVDNSQLRDNIVTIQLQSTWPGLETERRVYVVKMSDSGEVFLRVAECLTSGSVARCSARFANSASGFSSFALASLPTKESAPVTVTPTPASEPVGPTPAATPVASPTQVAPTPTLTATPTATTGPGQDITPSAGVSSPGDGGTGGVSTNGALVISLAGIAILVAAAGAGAVFLYGRQKPRSPFGGGRTADNTGMD